MERYLVASLPPHRDEEAPTLAVRLRRVNREVRAPDDPELHLRVDEERDAHRVLLPAQEAFRPVDGVDGPHPC
jgi:hypothetical protein